MKSRDYTKTSGGFHEIWQISWISHEIITTDSSEIPHFLLVSHMESGGFHIKSIKCTNEIHSEIHNEIHIKICIIIQ